MLSLWFKIRANYRSDISNNFCCQFFIMVFSDNISLHIIEHWIILPRMITTRKMSQVRMTCCMKRVWWKEALQFTDFDFQASCTTVNSRLHSESQFPNHLRNSNQSPDFQKIWKKALVYLVWTRPLCHSWFLKHLICPVVSFIQHPSQLSIWQCNVLIFRRYGRKPWVIWFGWEDGVTHLWSLRSMRCPRHYNPRNHWILHKSKIYKLSCVIYITKILPNSWHVSPRILLKHISDV